jgi:hypothetical protein
MPKDLSDVDPDESDLSPEQKRLMVWRDYFKLLRDGLAAQQKGSSNDEWTEKDVQTRLWLDVAITEIESDVMHLECGQEEYCRWGDAKALSKLSGNIYVSR